MEKKLAVRKNLQQYYSRNPTRSPPDNTTMRLVPEVFAVCHSQTVSDIERLRIRQHHFLNHIGEMTHLGIVYLEHKVWGKTLCNRIMNIPSITDPNVRLFHTITPHWQGQGVIFYFLPHIRSEAEHIAAGLLTYIRAQEKKAYPELYNTTNPIV